MNPISWDTKSREFLLDKEASLLTGEPNRPVVRLVMERDGVQMTAQLLFIGLDPTIVESARTFSIESGQKWSVRNISL
jgi:hypothetical protein